MLKINEKTELVQLAFCKVQVTGEDEFLRFSKLTAIGNDENQIVLSLTSNIGRVRFFRFEMETNSFTMMGMNQSVNRDWKN
jgi:hypothetical protein